MKHLAARSITTLALLTTMGLSIPAVASAHSSTTTAVASTTWTTWHAKWVTYIKGLKSVNASYRSSIQAARSAYLSARATATTKAERQAALAILDAALATAINTRVSAISAVGVPPTPPAGYNATPYVAGIQAANVAFRATTTAAQRAYAKALASATTSAQRTSARLTLKAAFATALETRSAALLALGTPPTHPGKKA